MSRDYPDEDLEVLHLNDNDYEVDESDFLETGEIPVIEDNTASRKSYYAQEDEYGIYDIDADEEPDYTEDESDYIEDDPGYEEEEPEYEKEEPEQEEEEFGYSEEEPEYVDEEAGDYVEEPFFGPIEDIDPEGTDPVEPEGTDPVEGYDPEGTDPVEDYDPEGTDPVLQPANSTILGPKVVLEIPREEQPQDLPYEELYGEPGMEEIPAEPAYNGDYDTEPQPGERERPRKKQNKSGRKKKSPAGRKKGRRRKKRRGRSNTVHNVLIVLLIILLIGAIAAGVRLYFWDMGQESEYDPDNVTDEFDVETEDYLLPLSPQMAELQADDGVNSILILGNDLIANDRGKSDGIAALIEKYTGGKVYDATIKNTFMSIKNPQLDESYIDDIYSLYWLVQCIKLNEFDPLKNYAPGWDGDEKITEIVDMLANLDMSTIDTIFIMYDFHDYSEGRMLASPVDDQFPVSASACLGLSLMGIKQTFPHIRVVVGSPYFSYANGESGETADFGYGVLGDYMISYKNVAVNNDASFIDNYFGSITVDNYKEYLDDDYAYPNEKGKEILAKRAADFIGRAAD